MMGVMGTGELIAAIIGILFWIFIIKIIINMVRKNGKIHMSLRKFEINPDPEAENIIIIEGRKSGLWAWLLVQLKLGNIYQLHVKKEHMSYLAESLAGKSLSLVPLHKIASTSCGYEKPVGWFILGVIMLIIAVVFLFMGSFSSFFYNAIDFSYLFCSLYIFKEFLYHYRNNRKQLLRIFF